MKRFQRFLGRSLDTDFLNRDSGETSYGVSKRYVPEEIDVFDELEFGLGSWQENQLVLIVVLEKGNLGRISLGYVPPDGDEDDLMAFTPEQLDSILHQQGQRLEGFLTELFPAIEF